MEDLERVAAREDAQHGLDRLVRPERLEELHGVDGHVAIAGCVLLGERVGLHDSNEHRDSKLAVSLETMAAISPAAAGARSARDRPGPSEAPATRVPPGRDQPERVWVLSVEDAGERRGLVVHVERKGTTYLISLADLEFDPTSPFQDVIAAYREMLGIARPSRSPLQPACRPGSARARRSTR